MSTATADEIVRRLAEVQRAQIVVDDPDGYRCVLCNALANNPVATAAEHGHSEDCPFRLAREWIAVAAGWGR